VLDIVMYGGFEHHFWPARKDIVAELRDVCSILDIPSVTP